MCRWRCNALSPRFPRRGALLLVLGVWLVCGHQPALVQAEKPTVESKTKAGLHFELPPDWPVEKRGGIVAPIPIEEYLGRKFGVMAGQLRVLEQQLTSFELRLRVLENRLKKQKQLRSGTTAP